MRTNKQTNKQTNRRPRTSYPHQPTESAWVTIIIIIIIIIRGQCLRSCHRDKVVVHMNVEKRQAAAADPQAKPTTWAMSPPVGCYRLHLLLFIITQPESRYSILILSLSLLSSSCTQQEQ